MIKTLISTPVLPWWLSLKFTATVGAFYYQREDNPKRFLGCYDQPLRVPRLPSAGMLLWKTALAICLLQSCKKRAFGSYLSPRRPLDIIFGDENRFFRTTPAKRPFAGRRCKKYSWKGAQKALWHCRTQCKQLAATSHLMKHQEKLHGNLSGTVEAGEDEWERTVSSNSKGKRKESWVTWLVLGLNADGSVNSSSEDSFDYMKQRWPNSGVFFYW